MSKYRIFQKNKGDDYSKTPETLIFLIPVCQIPLENHNACISQIKAPPWINPCRSRWTKNLLINRSGEKATGFSVQQSPFKRDMVFMDVGTLDECRELHLVCHVYRMGRMVAPSSTLSSPGTQCLSIISEDVENALLHILLAVILNRSFLGHFFGIRGS